VLSVRFYVTLHGRLACAARETARTHPQMLHQATCQLLHPRQGIGTDTIRYWYLSFGYRFLPLAVAVMHGLISSDVSPFAIFKLHLSAVGSYDTANEKLLMNFPYFPPLLMQSTDLMFL